MTRPESETAADRAAAHRAGKLFNRVLFTLAIYWLSGAALQSEMLQHAWWGRLLLTLVVPLLIASVALTVLLALDHPLSQLKGVLTLDKGISIVLFLAAWLGSQDELHHHRAHGAALPPLLPPWEFLALYMRFLSG